MNSDLPFPSKATVNAKNKMSLHKSLLIIYYNFTQKLAKTKAINFFKGKCSMISQLQCSLESYQMLRKFFEVFFQESDEVYLWLYCQKISTVSESEPC